jgi:hypothetical protein
MRGGVDMAAGTHRSRDWAWTSVAARIGRIGSLVAAILMVSVSQDGLGDEPLPAGSGQLRAVASDKELPRGIRVTIEPGPDHPEFGDAPLYVAARAVVDQALARRGFRAGSPSNLTLEFGIDVTGFKARRRRPLRAFPGLPPAPGEEDDRSRVEHQFEIPLVPRLQPIPSRISITLVLFRPGAPPLWSATVTAADHVKFPEALVARLTKAAMAAFGASAERRFILSCDPEARGPEGSCLE